MADESSTETLRHYRCSYCERIRAEQIASGVPESRARPSWWSIADGPEDCPCPWCAQEGQR
ncbi:MAG: hypothetical protein ACLFSR_03775 [Halomonas sp.]